MCEHLCEGRKKAMEEHFAFTAQSCIFDMNKYSSVLFPSWPVVDLNKSKGSSASLLKQKSRNKWRVSYSAGGDVVLLGVGVRGDRDGGDTMPTAPACAPELPVLPRRENARGSRAGRWVCLSRKGMCEQGIQGPETRPGAPSQAWCLTGDRGVWPLPQAELWPGDCLAWQQLHSNPLTLDTDVTALLHHPCLGSVELIGRSPKTRTEGPREHLPFPGVLSGTHLALAIDLTPASNLLSWCAELRSSLESDNVTLHPFLKILFSP